MQGAIQTKILATTSFLTMKNTQKIQNYPNTYVSWEKKNKELQNNFGYPKNIQHTKTLIRSM